MKPSLKALRLLVLTALLLIALAVCASATELKIGVGIVDASTLRVRTTASTDGDIITNASNGDYVVVIREVDGWYLVDYNLNIGYVSKDYITFKAAENVELGVGCVNTDVVNVRGTPSSDGSAVGQLLQGAKVNIIGINNGWYKVTYGETTGYIRSDLLVLTECPKTNAVSSVVGTADLTSASSSSSTASSSSSSGSSSAGAAETVTASTVSAGQSIVDCAKKYLGVPYVWGGTTTSGFDCSGFTQYVFRQMGYTINRTAAQQMSNGTSVSYSNLQVGDLVFFNGTYSSKTAASHVGIYIGNGQFIHCAGSGVKITSLSSSYYASRYVGARRIVG